ncbi:WD repeat-containing protein 76-like [Xenia sp. Carnegie-2017]|uniref:WD repeat-containing protein 76-like n=1 Tax=Xenia sp. Carnegie-2017 TaxID=2897299 RepID=UPI001F044446|nr:WD repeat-containing protein 76-like [Xenia sp. Carnegie-2017]
MEHLDGWMGRDVSKDYRVLGQNNVKKIQDRDFNENGDYLYGKDLRLNDQDYRVAIEDYRVNEQHCRALNEIQGINDQSGVIHSHFNGPIHVHIYFHQDFSGNCIIFKSEFDSLENIAVMKKKVVEPARRSPRVSQERASNQFEMITLPDLRIYPADEERIKGPIDANPINDVGDDANKKFMNSLELLSNETKMTTSVVPVEASSPQSYKQRISKFSLTSDRIRKVVPKRITTMAFHPCCDKTIVAAGDNAGNIGIWNVDASKEDDDVIMYRPHAGNVRQVYFHPLRNNSLFSSSVDGSLR